ncbi:16S rRNA (cytosine(1402)-N(4))-methyltransferase RsmH [Albibacterium bauzanense]|uniref:Ribosomal RNA small subunit methyltransferase H n=1 Tax=Albibacterium bauzanense TaxID=653929 RepID=A0A4R1LVT2_9SPHI|nr:16S rRNA (cytosine(1402)-N(4))-methyltransferase RsmH [Albibacterium bauzanense]TCK83518.1 16S rRNA (cytosine1402-N4)-methyltransferase [Albibacterium bauzanense]
MENEYHIPVMLNECIEGLHINPDGIYVDVTFGGGGHSREILAKLSDLGRLYAFDQDPDAKRNVILDSRFTLIQQNFRFLKNNLRLHGVETVDGILADLGISSHQINERERGFSTRFDAQLDMRMDQVGELNAKEVVNSYSEEELHRIFGMYGEVQNAKTLARAIVSARSQEPIVSIDQLKSSISRVAPRNKENKYYAQVFQALRIEVNKELEALEAFLQQSVSVLKPGGRLVVMSYHSLEDRLVKNYMLKGKFRGEVEKDFYGNEIKPFKVISKKVIVASAEEVERNNRARSAKLRIAERI